MDDLQGEVELQRRVQQLSEVLRSTYEQLDELEEEVQELSPLTPVEPRNGQGGAGDVGEELGQQQRPEAPGSAQTLSIIVKKALRDTLQLSRHVALMRMRLLQHQLSTRSAQVAEVVADRLETSPRADAASSSSEDPTEDETPEGADIRSVRSCTSTLSHGIRKRRSTSVRFYRKSGVYSTTNTTSPEALSSPLTAKRHRKVKFYLGETRKYKHALSRLGRRTRLRYPSDGAINEGDPPSARTRSKLRSHLPSILRKTANLQRNEQSSRKTRASSRRGADASGGHSCLSAHYAAEEVVNAPKFCYTTRKRSLDSLHSKKRSTRPEKSHKIARGRAEAKDRQSRSRIAVHRQTTSGSQSDSALLTKRSCNLRRKDSEYPPTKHATQDNRNISLRVKEAVTPSHSSSRAGSSETNQRKSDLKQSHNSTGDERFPLKDTNKFSTAKFPTASVIKLETCNEAQDSGADDSKQIRGRVKEVGPSTSSRAGRTFEKAVDVDSSRVRRHSAPAQTLGRGQPKAKCVDSKTGFTGSQNEVDANVGLGYRGNLKFKEVTQSSSKYSSGYLGDTENSPCLNTRSRAYRSSGPMITEESRLIDSTASSADNTADDMDVQSSPLKTRRNRQSILP